MTFSYEQVLCPLCNGPMISRKSNYGVFWGCKNYPQCTGRRDNTGEARSINRDNEDKKELREVMGKVTFNKDKK